MNVSRRVLNRKACLRSESEYSNKAYLLQLILGAKLVLPQSTILPIYITTVLNARAEYDRIQYGGK